MSNQKVTEHENYLASEIVEDLIICELKAAKSFEEIWLAQVLTYLKLTGKKLGFILNFNCIRMKNGIKRVVL